MWIQKGKYWMQNGTSTIAKVKLGDKTTYELWFDGKQYPNHETLYAAISKYEQLKEIC